MNLYYFIKNYTYKIFLILFILYLLMSISYSIMYTQFIDILIYILYITLILFISWYVIRRKDTSYIISDKIFLISIFIFSILIRLYVVFVLNVEQSSDFHTLYEAAIDMVNGKLDIGMHKGSYFYRYNFQIGYTSYLYILMKLFNTTSIYIVYVSNVFWSSLNVLIIYLITKTIFNTSSARIASILLCILGSNILSNSLANNGIIANTFYLSAVYIFLNNIDYRIKKLPIKYLLVGLLLGLGHILRTITPVYIIAIIIYILLHTVIKNRQYKLAIIQIFSIISSYIIIVFIYSHIIISVGMTSQNHFENPMISTWKVLVGTNYETNGHIGEVERELQNKLRREWDNDYERFNNEAKVIIKERILSNPSKYFYLIISKFNEFWGKQDSTSYWVIRGNQSLSPYLKYGTVLNNFIHNQLITIYLLGVVSSIKVNKNKQFHKTLLPIILLVGFTLAYSLYEIQTRYRYSTYFILIILSSYGMIIILEFLTNYFKRNEV